MQLGKMIAAAMLLGIGYSAHAGVMLNSLVYSENFDSTLSSTTATGAFSATVGVQAAIPGTSGWDGAKIAGNGTGNMNFVVDNGTGNSGALYNYRTTGSTDFSLGSLASVANIAAFGVAITNNTGQDLTKVQITFDREQYRSSTSVQNVLAFAWGVSGGAITSTNYLSHASMTALTSLDAVGTPSVASNGIIAPPDIVTGITAAITFASPLKQGDTLFIRWQDTNDAGNDGGIAIDNFSAVFTPVPEPASLALVGLGGLLLLGRRRQVK